MKPSETFTTTLTDAHKEKRLDVVLSQVFPNISRSKIQSLLKDKKIMVNGQYLKAKSLVEGGEEVILHLEKGEATSQDKPQALPLEILYEDDDILIINKKAGMVVHPGAGNPHNTLINALLFHFPLLKEVDRAGIVHRLDKETSGALIIAKNAHSQKDLQAQFAQRTVLRQYHALVVGRLISGQAINMPIGRNPHNRLKMRVFSTQNMGEESGDEGKEAITHIRVLERFREHTLLQCELETGRTHQIRVHLQHIHHPIVGDLTYGGRLKIPKQFLPKSETILREFKRQALHAYKVGFTHPKTKAYHAIKAPYPKEFINLIKAMREDKEHFYNQHN